LGNYFLPKEIVEGTTTLFTKPFSPDVIRFCMMQAHYRSNLDLSEDSLNAAEKGFARLSDALALMEKVNTGTISSFDVQAVVDSFYSAMDDDFNAPILMANLFEAARYVNLINDGKETITASDLTLLRNEIHGFVQDVLGLNTALGNSDSKLAPVMDLVLELRQHARENKDWTSSDRIRDGLAAAGIVVKDGKDGTSWS
jgi:cysteinyl-tRNA synthetase